MADFELHPGVHVALARSNMDEAQLARAIASGELASPQQYGNSWYFNLRITGTGGAYRQELDEYVWRDPKIYLNQGFLDRCNGLPVIVEHPNKEMLDSKEYHNRNIGVITYPYIKGEDVFGIARILDQPAAKYLREHQLSTSPAVVFRSSAIQNEKIKVGDGKHLLIEGKPSLLDHLAICEEGVWDKGGPPAGVDLTGEKEATVADEKETKEERNEENREDRRDDRKRDDRARDDRRDGDDDERMDADAGEKLDRLLEGIKVLSDRMDSIERRDRKDAASAEEEAEQAAELHKIAEEEEQEAQEAAEDDSTKKDKRDDRARDDKKDSSKKDEDEMMMDKAGRKDAKEETEEEAEGEMPWEDVDRKEGESDAAYARRVDALAKKHDAKQHMKRDDESNAAYCDRVSRDARKDRARKDAKRRLSRVDAIADSVSKLGKRFDGLMARFTDRSDDDEAAFADAQSKADEVYGAFGDHAPRSMRGESLTAYRVRLMRPLQKHSAAWKDSDLRLFTADPAAFKNVETLVYADAMTAARLPINIEPGTLREIVKRRPGGGEIHEFAGEPLSWMRTFMAPGRACTRLNTRRAS